MDHYTLMHALVGGCLIGLASLIAGALSEKVPGISGVFGRLLLPATPDKLWRVFLAGLIGGAALSFALWESAAIFRPMRPLAVMAGAGLLVGLGTRLGKGCTSGHGVCGVAAGAKDSIAATMMVLGKASRRDALQLEGKLLATKSEPIDRRLVIGAAIFGVGWGLSGFCPGPALANLGALRIEALIFVPAMAIGMVVAQQVFGADSER